MFTAAVVELLGNWEPTLASWLDQLLDTWIFAFWASCIFPALWLSVRLFFGRTSTDSKEGYYFDLGWVLGWIQFIPAAIVLLGTTLRVVITPADGYSVMRAHWGFVWALVIFTLLAVYTVRCFLHQLVHSLHGRSGYQLHPITSGVYLTAALLPLLSSLPQL